MNYRYTPEEIGQLNAEIDWLRAEREEMRSTVMDWTRMFAENKALRAALLEIASNSKWSAIEIDGVGAERGLAIVSEMQRIARTALTDHRKVKED